MDIEAEIDVREERLDESLEDHELFYMDQSIKSEITFEPEKITEASYLHLPEEQICQLDLGSSMDIVEEFYQSNNLNAIGEMCELQENDEEQFMDSNVSEVSDALNDHNYTSQEVVPSPCGLDSVKDILLSHIVSNRSVHETVPANVSNFIDSTINSIKELQLEFSDKGMEEALLAECLSQGNNVILPENCSEPLEADTNDEYFESLYKNINDNNTVANTLLVDTINFAKELCNECNLKATKSENEFKSFILDKIQKLKKIANIQDTVDQSMQTHSKSFLRKRRRINHKAKRNLLDSSGSSDGDCSDSYGESDKRDSSAESSISALRDRNTVTENLKKEYDYNDGIDLSKYIKLEMTNQKFRQISSDYEDAEKQDSNSCSSGDNTDKEIDRLTNLNGLNKRYGQTKPSVKPKDKSLPKVLSKKNDNILNELNDDMEMYDSENSFKQSDDEFITENQYLSRFNEQIKKQLLDDSNSDSGLSDQSDYNLSKEDCSTDNETTKDVVDKFLEVFKCDNDDDPKDDELNDTKDNKSEVGIISKDSDSLDASDEFKTSLSAPKKSKKSFEKLLAEAERRNQNEEIVLSSESELSDADPEPVEEKTRIIKPMLRMDQLASETRVAQKSETDRIRRLEKNHSMVAKAIKNNLPKAKKGAFVLDYIESTKTFIEVDEHLVKLLKPHQKDGVKFMYDSCYAGIDHAKKNSGSGCILAHCMGLGKTLQLIALLHTVISYKELNTTKVLVLCPKSTVMNWADEVNRWLGPLKKKTPIKVCVFPDCSDISDKLRLIEEWSLSSPGKPGCLLVGYEAFRSLVFYHSYKNRGNLNPSKLESIRDKVNKFLLQPGADLVVCDEGHIIKNSKSAISLAVAKIKTPKRIILTGTPIQNNLKEYYSMVNFIKPLFLGTEKEFANLYANPIKNGQHKDSSKKDITVMKQRSYVLHKKLSKFVQRKEAELLQTFLPQKFEYVLFIPMSGVQNTLYEYILEAIASRGDSRGKSLITDYTVLRKIWTHPKVLEDAWKNANMLKNKKDNKRPGLPHSDDDQPDDIYDSQTGLISVTNDWWRKYLSKKDLETIMPSNKLRVMFSILRMCEEKGEKCLIFSAFVAVLNVVEYFFKKITENDPEILQHIHIPNATKQSNTWISGQDYYRLDGKTAKNIRHEMIKRFNSEANRRARVFLISAKAGGQGINLTGANRVIILDTSWNPSNDQQNIFRIFRLGQKKNCYIYRLIAMGTMEEKVYSRSVTKQAMSFRVVDEQQIDRHYNMAELAELYTLTHPQQSERPMPLLPKDTILAHLLRQSELVYKYHEHDTLLENKVEQELSEQEKADAWDTYERELQMNLAQQEGVNVDKVLNPAFPLKNPYAHMGGVPSLDMQTLLNYSLQSASLMPGYNYGMNPNYLDTLNLYQKYSSLRYPEMNSVLNDPSFTPNPFGVLNAPNMNRMVPTPPLMPNMSNSQNAKSLPRDFGLFDTQLRNNPLALSQLHHSLTAESQAQAISSASTSTNNVMSTLGQYKQLLENPLAGLLNYSAQAYGAPVPPPPPASAQDLQAKIQSLSNALYEKTLDNMDASKKDKRGKSNEQSNVQRSTTTPEFRATTTTTTAPVVTSVDLTKPTAATEASLSRNPLSLAKSSAPITGSIDLTSSSISSSAKNTTALKKLTAQSVKQRNAVKESNPSEEERNAKSTKSPIINFPAAFNANRASGLSKDYLKSNTEMQIIPTTSPPGTSSITKQLTEMPPSISLTAVNTIAESTKPRSSPTAKSTANVAKQPKDTFPTIKSVESLPALMTKSITAVEKSMPALSPVSATKKFAGGSVDSSAKNNVDLTNYRSMTPTQLAGKVPNPATALRTPAPAWNDLTRQNVNKTVDINLAVELGQKVVSKRTTDALSFNVKRTKYQ
ncbi:transcriptional regulator ATRX [Drosophila busckii]|uniref:transcriptional regulator ATRX n=1 Tax=Drosophila busckii TaxID=30019 RepID=UPI001432C98C|nr:transcriptional regulator ATRX [Drosophila busckii]